MTIAPQPHDPAHGPTDGAGLGNTSMVLGMFASVGSVFFLLLWFGMANESVGRSVESVSDDEGHLFHIVGCVGGMLALADLAGLALGLLALTKPNRSNGPAITGVVLCGIWLLVGVVVLLVRA